jgi:hypothetical protein
MTKLSEPAATKDATLFAPDDVAAEVYGSDNLPVLIQLPDLTDSAEREEVAARQPSGVPTPSVPPREDRSGASAGQHAAIRLADVEASEPQSAAEPSSQADAESPREHRLREQRLRRQQRASRRSVRDVSPSWFRGIRQLFLAAGLAGVLLVVIVGFQNRYRVAPQKTPGASDLDPIVEAPTLDIDDPALGSFTGTDLPPGPDLEPPTFSGNPPALDSLSPGNSPALDLQGQRGPTLYGSQSPTDGRNARMAATVPDTASQVVYPDTGAPGVAEPAVPPVRRDVPGWSETLPAIRNVELPTSQPGYQQR